MDEWRLHNSKILNNGNILPVDEDPQSDSRDSTMEPGSSVGPDGIRHTDHTKTPRSTTFTPINSIGISVAPQEGVVEQTPDGLPTPDANTAQHTQWRYPPPSQNSQQHQPPPMPMHVPHPVLQPQMQPTRVSTDRIPLPGYISTGCITWRSGILLLL